MGRGRSGYHAQSSPARAGVAPARSEADATRLDLLARNLRGDILIALADLERTGALATSRESCSFIARRKLHLPADALIAARWAHYAGDDAACRRFLDVYERDLDERAAALERAPASEFRDPRQLRKLIDVEREYLHDFRNDTGFRDREIVRLRVASESLGITGAVDEALVDDIIHQRHGSDDRQLLGALAQAHRLGGDRAVAEALEGLDEASAAQMRGICAALPLLRAPALSAEPLATGIPGPLELSARFLDGRNILRERVEGALSEDPIAYEVARASAQLGVVRNAERLADGLRGYQLLRQEVIVRSRAGRPRAEIAIPASDVPALVAHLHHGREDYSAKVTVEGTKIRYQYIIEGRVADTHTRIMISGQIGTTRLRRPEARAAYIDALIATLGLAPEREPADTAREYANADAFLAPAPCVHRRRAVQRGSGRYAPMIVSCADCGYPLRRVPLSRRIHKATERYGLSREPTEAEMRGGAEAHAALLNARAALDGSPTRVSAEQLLARAPLTHSDIAETHTRTRRPDGAPRASARAALSRR